MEAIDVVCGIYFHSVLLEYEGDFIRQHEHEVDHATYVGSGKARLWINDQLKGDFVAGTPIEVKRGDRHAFQALQPNTRLCCVFNAEDPVVKSWIEGAN